MFFLCIAVIAIIIMNLFSNILCIIYLPFLTKNSMWKDILSQSQTQSQSLSLAFGPQCLAQDFVSIHTLKIIVELINILIDLLV